MNGLLTYDELNKLIENAIRAELWEPQKRRLLFFRMTDLSAKVALMPNPELQLRADMIFLDGSIPRDGVPRSGPSSRTVDPLLRAIRSKTT